MLYEGSVEEALGRRPNPSAAKRQWRSRVRAGIQRLATTQLGVKGMTLLPPRYTALPSKKGFSPEAWSVTSWMTVISGTAWPRRGRRPQRHSASARRSRVTRRLEQSIQDGAIQMTVLGGQGWATRRPERPSWEDSGNELN